MTTVVNILGSEWTVEITVSGADNLLATRDGYCDYTSRRIVVCDKEEDCELDNFIEHRNKVLRHEVVHAFLFESGLGACFEHREYGHEETLVDWIAYQFPKICEVFRQLQCL